jgi:hypothetical protein
MKSCESAARSLGVQDEQLLKKGEVFEDEILAGTKGANQPTQMPEPHDHGQNLIELLLSSPLLTDGLCTCKIF